MNTPTKVWLGLLMSLGSMLAVPAWADVDLAITSMTSTATSTMPIGTSYTITATVKNQGTTQTSAITSVGFYRSTDPTFATGSTFIGNAGSIMLAAGGSTTVTMPAVAPNTVGTYYLKAVVDYNNQQPETDETNNTLAGPSFVVATLPGVPTNVNATAGNTQATVSFPPPANNGGAAITSYKVTSSPGGITATGTASPIIVTGLTNGTAYTFTVQAINAIGTGSASTASNSVTPNIATSTTTTTLTATPNPVVGQAVTLTATVTGVNPGGTVTFNDGTTVLGSATLSNSSATLSYTFPTAGFHGLSAVYAGDANNAASATEVVTQAVVYGGLEAWGYNGDGETTVPTNLNGVVAISARYLNTVALKSDGTVVAWGDNTYGQTTVPASLNGVVEVAAGITNSAAIKSDGSVVVWGNNNFGQNTAPAGLSGVVAVSCGNYDIVALKNDGTVVGWGMNSFGEATAPAGLSGVVAIAAGPYHTVALKNDGTVVAWGFNFNGQTNVPEGLSGVVAIAAGLTHTVALKSDGTVVAWGDNTYGAATVPAGLSGVVAISAGYNYTVALKSDGTVVAWGNNNWGQTILPADLHGVVAISAGSAFAVAALNYVPTATPTTTALTVSPNPVLAGQNATLTATVTGDNPTGSVDFVFAGGIWGTGTLVGGVATMNQTYTQTTPTGVIAVYTGDSNNSPSISAQVQVSVINPITVSLTSPTSGTTIAAPATLTLMANATSQNTTITGIIYYDTNWTLIGQSPGAPFSFTWSNIPVGTHNITAYAYDSLGNSNYSAPVSISVVNSVPPMVSLTSPTNGTTLAAPATLTLSADATSTTSSIAKVDFYNGATLLGTSTTAPYNYNWSNVPAGAYNLTAIATDNLGAATTSSAVNINVVSDVPPTVSLTSPANGATATAPASFTLTANATDADGSIAKVDFYNGATLLGTATAVPYSYAWSSVPAGTYSLTAIATDNLGAATTSSAVNVSVAPSAPPLVSLTAPLNGATANAPGSFILSANASSASSTVAKVDFYSDTTLLGTATAAPYTLNWTNIPVGTYSLTAVATDALGGSSVSVPYTAKVINNNSALNIAVNSPTPDATINDDNVLVSGTFMQGLSNIGITVNGIVAAQYGNNFYALVPLQTGANTINLTATTVADGMFSQTFSVNSTGPAPIQIKADTMSGPAPLTVNFSVQHNSGNDIYQIDADYNGDGVVDFSGTDPPPSWTSIPLPAYTYTTPGVYQADFKITDNQNNVVDKTFLVVVQDTNPVDQAIRAQWSGMTSALLAGDKQTAMNYLSDDAQLKYGPVFDLLVSEFPDILPTWSSLLSSSITGNMAEYAVVTDYGGKRQVFFVYFMLGDDGVWRLVSM